MTLGPVRNSLLALVATHPLENAVLRPLTEHSVVLVADAPKPRATAASEFNGASHLVIKDGSNFNMTSGDFSITARIRTMTDGTIFCKANDQGPWVPNGKTFFVRGGRLCYDIGWVGAVQSKKKVDDGRWHDVESQHQPGHHVCGWKKEQRRHIEAKGQCLRACGKNRIYVRQLSRLFVFHR